MARIFDSESIVDFDVDEVLKRGFRPRHCIYLTSIQDITMASSQLRLWVLWAII